jgi:hypothetical protein
LGDRIFSPSTWELGDRSSLIERSQNGHVHLFKGRSILSMAAEVGAIAVCRLGDRFEGFNGEKVIARHQAHSGTPTHMAITP